MDMEYAEVVVVGIDHDKLGDGVLAHEVQCLDGIFSLGNAFGVGRHDVLGLKPLNRGVILDHATEVAVGDDALDKVALGDDGATEALGCHFEDGVLKRGVGRNLGTLVLLVEVGDAHIELLAEGSARVEASKVVGAEVAAFDEGNGKGVSHNELCGGAGGGGQVVGACLVVHGGVEHDVGLVGKEGVGVAHYSDKGVAEVLEQGYEHFNLGGITALGDADHNVVGLHHTEVAVDGIGGMKKQGWGTCGVEGRHYLGGYVGALANACNYYSSGGRKYFFYCHDEAVIDIIRQIGNRFFLFFNNLYCNRFYLFCRLHYKIYFVVPVFFANFVIG